MPNPGDEFTHDQAMQIPPENWSEVAHDDAQWEVCNDWHGGPGEGVFDPRAMGWGYQDGFPVYAGVSIEGKKYHVYWIRNQNAFWLDPNTP